MRGVCPVVEVPFHPDETLDLPGFSTLLDHLLGTGMPGLMFPGYASEFHKLDEAERRELTGILLDRTRTRPDVAAVIAVQDHATRVAVRRAEDAVAQGADALNLLPPHLLGPAPEAVRAHLAAVLAAVAPVPVIVQYAPNQTGAALDPAVLAGLAAEHPNLAAVKVESTPPGRFVSALAAGSPSLPSLVGYAGLHLPDALERGAAGVQPGCSFTELYQRIWRSWQAGDRAAARAVHTRMLPYLSYWMQSVELIVAVEKLISVRRGFFAGALCRAPCYRLDDHEVAQVESFLAEFGAELGPGGGR